MARGHTAEDQLTRNHVRLQNQLEGLLETIRRLNRQQVPSRERRIQPKRTSSEPSHTFFRGL